MLQKAVEHYNSVGREQALADFNHKKAPFGDRDLYVVCIGPHDVLTANGGFPQYVGSSPDILKDADGKPVGKAIWETGNSKGEGSVKYLMINPVSRKTEPKITFVQKVGEVVRHLALHRKVREEHLVAVIEKLADDTGGRVCGRLRAERATGRVEQPPRGGG